MCEGGWLKGGGHQTRCTVAGEEHSYSHKRPQPSFRNNTSFHSASPLLHHHVCLSVYLSICLSVCLSVRPSVCLFVWVAQALRAVSNNPPPFIQANSLYQLKLFVMVLLLFFVRGEYPSISTDIQEKLLVINACCSQ